MNRSLPLLQRMLFVLSVILFCTVVWIIASSLNAPKHYNTIVLTIESLRDDCIRPDSTPYLLQASTDGYRFTNHRAISGWTGTNIITILTGLSPFRAGVHTRGQSILESEQTPLEKLSHLKYKVEGLQGFMGMNIYSNLGLSVQPQTDDPLYWLALKCKNREPFFFWYHYVHTHLPYSESAGYISSIHTELDQNTLPPSQAKRLSLVRKAGSIHYSKTVFQPEDIDLIHELQESTVREFDDWFNRFWEFFNSSGLRKNTILVLTADHGDEHGERGLVGHASTTQLGHLHEEIVRVPLFIWLPDDLAPETKSDFTAHGSSHEDIMPTLFTLLGLEPQTPLSGRNLFGKARHSEWKAMTSSGGFAEKDPQNIRYFEYAVLKNNMKLLLRINHSGEKTAQLFDLENDPGEQHNLAEVKPEITKDLIKTLQPHITNKITLASSVPPQPSFKQNGPAPTWLHPHAEGTYSYDEMQGKFKLEWTGSEKNRYILEYIAGDGASQLQGTLKVEGNSKDFGQISRRYWQTWIVPKSPIRVRIRQAEKTAWSDWLEFEAIP